MTTHRYGPGRDQVADLRLPAGHGPHPAAVLIHGGFWRARYTRELMDGLAGDLSRRGWATLNVEYRRVGAGGGVPATLDDVLAAIDMLDELDAPLDTARTIVVGHSAGGQLALWLAARRPLLLAVSLAGVACLEAAALMGIGGGAVRDLCGGTPAEAPDAYALADPYVQLPLGVPQLVVHGDCDDVVPAELARMWAERAVHAGDACELMMLRGVDHFELINPASPAWSTVCGRLPGVGLA